MRLLYRQDRYQEWLDVAQTVATSFERSGFTVRAYGQGSMLGWYDRMQYGDRGRVAGFLDLTGRAP